MIIMKAVVVEKLGIILVKEIPVKGEWKPAGYPFITGHEFSGDIIETGSKVNEGREAKNQPFKIFVHQSED